MDLMCDDYQKAKENRERVEAEKDTHSRYDWLTEDTPSAIIQVRWNEEKDGKLPKSRDM